MKLIIWDEDWSDEFSIFGFETMHETDYDRLIAELKKAIEEGDDKEEEWYFGTNECMYWCYSDILRILENSTQDITDEENAVIRKLFGHQYYFPLVNRGQTFSEQVVDSLDYEV